MTDLNVNNNLASNKNEKMADLERQEPNTPWLTPPSTPWSSDTTSRTILDNNNVTSNLKEEKTDSTIQPPQDTRLIRAKREIRRITLHFTPSWFSVNMGTGITSILLHQLPYQFNGLGIISNVIFGLNVFLFLIFFGISLARYTIWPNLFWTMLFHPTQSLFLGTFAMGFATIVNMCALSAAPAFGYKFAIFTWVLWWIDAVISILICIGCPFLQFTRHEQSHDKVTGVWFLPVVSTIVAAASGGIVAEILPPAHARLTLIISWILWGTGFSLAILLMALYYGRLAIYKIPPGTLIVSAFLPLGPCGQGAFGLLQMSSVLYKMSKTTGQALGSLSTATATEAQTMATAIYAVTVPIALVIWGLGLVWLVLAVAFLIDLAIVQELSFNLGWWGFTFPLGVFCTATTQLAKELDSGGFRVLGTVLSLIEVALWLYIAIKTTIGALSGKLFFSPCLAEQGGEPPLFVNPARKYTYEARKKSNSPKRFATFISRSTSRSRGRSP
jgi:C4-dicarboxylate transporter/malic acid transport protein